MASKVSLDDAMAGDEQATSTPKRRASKSKEPVKPVKLTIELDPGLHRSLKSFALLKADDASLADIVRAAIALADRDAKIGKALAGEAARIKSERKAGR